ncbi:MULTISPECIES: dihydrolipoyl dehydrogenase family protein [Mameliella]|uniref:dihydrolipoyl dehydrogenase family protein n=1 Tax=Mameliella TaxID=1434019 RepID=UPI001E626345|nr:MULTISPECIES: NAD(P)/FAD-dependent oxidoreductase [Mameliella]
MDLKDLIVIGAGMAGVNAARKCASNGWDVAIVDALPYGGTCALRGCDPKKMLRRGAEIVDAARLMTGKGIDPGDLRIDWPDLMAHKRSFTEAVPDKMESGLDKAGVGALHGKVRFVNDTTLAFEDGRRVEARRFFIATGAMPRPLDLPGAELMVDSTAFLELPELPRRIVFVGGGYVSFEFAHIAARAGAEVTIIDRGERPLKAFDPDLVDLLLERTRAAGIDVQLRTGLVSITHQGPAFAVRVETSGRERRLACDLVVHGAGRIPALDDLNLEAAGIDRTKKGVKVHPHLQSISAGHVYAAGDAADTPGAPLTPVAVFEGKVAASNILKGETTAPDYTGVPNAGFTIPELVRVGLLESDARELGHEVEVNWTDASGWYSQKRIGETHAAAKFVYEAGTGRILGAHLFGPGYAELVNIVGLAMRLDLTSKDLKRMVNAYPSTGSDLGSLL